MVKTILALGWLVATALWILGMTRWRQSTLARLPQGSSAWFWLRLLGLPETELNRGRLLTVASAADIATTTIGTALILAFGSD
jgi:hypothetical protein